MYVSFCAYTPFKKHLFGNAVSIMLGDINWCYILVIFLIIEGELVLIDLTGISEPCRTTFIIGFLNLTFYYRLIVII